MIDRQKIYMPIGKFTPTTTGNAYQLIRSNTYHVCYLESPRQFSSVRSHWWCILHLCNISLNKQTKNKNKTKQKQKQTKTKKTKTIKNKTNISARQY